MILPTVTQHATNHRAPRWLVATLLLWLAACSDDPDSTNDAEQSGPVVTDDNRDASVSRADAATSSKDAASPSESDASEPETASRVQDSRTFVYDEAMAEFAALDGFATDRFWGVLDGAGYQIEVPEKWNGILVMYAHGYAGTGEALRITTPGIRRHLVENGYAWAASSYTKNYYDVRAGVEDTNKLALAFKQIAADNGRELEEPTKRYLIGHSMGGHVTAAAIEKEASTTAANKVRYAGAVPMCGVVGDTELFNYFAAYQYAAQSLAGIEPTRTPAEFMAIRMQLRDALFTTYPTETTPAGDKVKTIVESLTGGARPNFAIGFASMQWQDAVWNAFGGDGTINGILSKPVIDTRKIVYQLDRDPAQSDEERTFNEDVFRAEPAPDANAVLSDGVRFIPVVNGEIDIPVVSLHTLGDLYVPFKMEQVYRERVDAKGNGDYLVQRAIRGTGHCDFTLAEQIAAFDDMAHWEQDGVKPEGDEVLDLEVVASPDYGCKFSINEYTEAEQATVAVARKAVPACP
ncbi:MAG: alpha/beta hydrolase [Polyangiales bacterium]